MLNTNSFAVHSMTTNKTTTYTKSDINQIFQCIRLQHDDHGQQHSLCGFPLIVEIALIGLFSL